DRDDCGPSGQVEEIAHDHAPASPRSSNAAVASATRRGDGCVHLKRTFDFIARSGMVTVLAAAGERPRGRTDAQSADRREEPAASPMDARTRIRSPWSKETPSARSGPRPFGDS